MKTLNAILVIQFIVLTLATSCSSDEVIENPPVVNQAPAIPVLSAPADDEENVELEEVELKWQRSRDPDGDDVSYDVFLGQQNPPETRVASNLIEANHILDKMLVPNTIYYWQVQAIDGLGNKNRSDASPFTTRPPNTAELLIGKWQLESALDRDGKPVELTDCDKQSGLEFSSDGIMLIKIVGDNSQSEGCTFQTVGVGYIVLNSKVIQIFIENNPQGEISQLELIALSETALKTSYDASGSGSIAIYTKVP